MIHLFTEYEEELLKDFGHAVAELFKTYDDIQKYVVTEYDGGMTQFIIDLYHSRVHLLKGRLMQTLYEQYDFSEVVEEDERNNLELHETMMADYSDYNRDEVYLS